MKLPPLLLLKSVAIAAVIGIVLYSLLVHTYTSSPGFAQANEIEAFYLYGPKCFGYSTLLNEKETWTGAPGESRCIGFLKR